MFLPLGFDHHLEMQQASGPVLVQALVTEARLNERDPMGDVHGWLQRIGEMS